MAGAVARRGGVRDSAGRPHRCRAAVLHPAQHAAAGLGRWPLAAGRQALRPAAALWVCWPKKASKVATDITEDMARELALPLGWGDIKVCAVSMVWSGLKLVVRKALR